MCSMRRSLSHSIDGVHDSAWIRRETEDAKAEGEWLKEKGGIYIDDMDKLNALADALEKAAIDQDEVRARLTELDRMLEEAEQDLQDNVIAEMEDNESKILSLQEMAEDAASEHESILEVADTSVEVTGFGITDVVDGVDSEGKALNDVASEAAKALDLQMQQAATLEREARMRAIRRGRS